MNSLPKRGQHLVLAAVFGSVLIWAEPSRAQSTAKSQESNEIRIVALHGRAEVSTDGGANWVSTQTNQTLKPSWHLRTGPDSRVALRWSDQSVIRFGALTEIEILASADATALSGLQLFKGILSFFHRDRPGRIRIITRGAVAGIEGTELVMKVDLLENTERTTLSVIEGKVRFTNEHDLLILTNGQQAVAEPGEAPQRTAGFIVNNILQWAFYYPGILDLNELPLSDEEREVLSESLVAYQSGDLLVALARYPEGRQPASDAERVYYAALLLSVGQVEQTGDVLKTLPAADPTNRLQRIAAAVRTLIAAVKRQPNPSMVNPQVSTEFLATSYHEQSRAVGDPSLRSALDLAKQAIIASPESGFAWARVAELEFSFGHTSSAMDALNKSLRISPRNAQALALKGFLLAAQNKSREALDWFNQAMAVDSALGNAWLGRGLCRIRHGDTSGGKEDLLIAAALEPQRALLRSYLGKAYGNAGDSQRALHELESAKILDPGDPTAWLYSALLNQESHRFNEGIRDLEQSQELNDNRRLYRSRLLLDQDQSVRSSSLATFYRDAGLADVSVREAASAVTFDYANFSAHLFLANSFDELRDPTRFNLRYETAWFNELLLANLLAPAGAGVFAQSISQQEYSRLFATKKFGLTTTTDLRSEGQYRQLASQFGNYGNFSYSFDLDYQHNDRIGADRRPNNELDRIEWYSQLKFQLTPADTLFLLTKYQDYHSGDNFQYYDWRGSVRTTPMRTNIF